MDDERIKTLKRIEASELSADEAVQQLFALSQAPQPEAEERVVPLLQKRRL